MKSRLRQTNLRECVYCCAKESFILDSLHAHYTCTNCGIVPYYIPEESMMYSFQNTDTPTIYRKNTTKEEKQIDQTTRAVNAVFPFEKKRDLMLKQIKNTSVMMSCTERVEETCINIVQNDYDTTRGKIIEKYGIDALNDMKTISLFDSLLNMRGLELTVIALLILCTVRCKQPLSLKMTKEYTMKKNISQRLKKICKMLKINFATFAVSKLASICSQMNIKFKYQKKIEQLFNKLKLEHQNVGDDTLIALAIYNILHKDHQNDMKEFLTKLASCTETNVNTLKNYINNKKIFN